MHLIFIRHGDPDYKIDSLTTKGEQEAYLLSERVSKWNITQSFTSPMGRAKKTAEIALKGKSQNLVTISWLREFNYPVKDLSTGKDTIAWDNMPRDYFSEKKYFDNVEWQKTALMKSGDISSHYKEVCTGFDSVLSRYGYKKDSAESSIYTCTPHLTQEESLVDTHLEPFQKNLDDRNLVFFCHLGVMFVIISHLTGISPLQLWQGFFVSPTSVTVLGAEERVPGETIFRVERLGDITHLLSQKEPPSASGFFGNIFSL